MTAAEKVLLARYAERAERYDEMARFMKERVQLGGALNQEERDMFSAAFKGAMSGRRIAVRVAQSAEYEEKSAGRTRSGEMAEGYKSRVSSELQECCVDAITVLTNNLVPVAEPGEPKTFYLKMMGDYYRYLAEFQSSPQREESANHAATCYQNATSEAESTLPATHAVRLGLALNFSVFQHEVIQNTAAAIALAKGAYDAAARDIQSSGARVDQDIELTMQLIDDNLKLWEGHC